MTLVLGADIYLGTAVANGVVQQIFNCPRQRPWVDGQLQLFRYLEVNLFLLFGFILRPSPFWRARASASSSYGAWIAPVPWFFIGNDAFYFITPLLKSEFIDSLWHTMCSCCGREFVEQLTKTKADIFKALGHPTRLWIVEQLADGEKCVCEFVEALDVDFSTVSKHLSILRNKGIVGMEKRGKQIFYHLAMPCLLHSLNCIDCLQDHQIQK